MKLQSRWQIPFRFLFSLSLWLITSFSGDLFLFWLQFSSETFHETFFKFPSTNNVKARNLLIDFSSFVSFVCHRSRELDSCLLPLISFSIKRDTNTLARDQIENENIVRDTGWQWWILNFGFLQQMSLHNEVTHCSFNFYSSFDFQLISLNWSFLVFFSFAFFSKS